MTLRKVFVKIRMEGISWQIKATKTTKKDLLEIMQDLNDLFDSGSKKGSKPKVK